MNALWAYFWPAFAAGLAIGAIGGLVGFRRGRIPLTVAGALAGAALAAALWHGPVGGADRLVAQVDRVVRNTLVYYEMTQIDARLERGPLTRRLHLSGPADDFQRGELVRVLSDVPGVSTAYWSGGRAMPLLVEGILTALLGALVGLLLAYLIELRRRYNAQWSW